MEKNGYLQMFQGMVTHDLSLTVNDMCKNISKHNGREFETRRLMKFATTSCVRFAAKGKLGSSLLDWDTQSTVEPPVSTGSIHFKINTGHTLTSVIAFPSAKKIKISGGFPKYAVLTEIAEAAGVSVADVVEWYINDIHHIVSSFVTGVGDTIFRMSMMNAGYDTGKHITPIDKLPLFANRFFHKVIAHEPELGGRRYAVKMYPKAGRTLNVACDHLGRVQIFSAHSMTEILDAIDTFEHMLSLAHTDGIKLYER